jgi:hypothetical protein
MVHRFRYGKLSRITVSQQLRPHAHHYQSLFMNIQMTVNGEVLPIGKTELMFEYFPNNDPPYASLHIQSDSDDEMLGGVAINCLNVGNVTSLKELQGKTLTFDDTEESGSELRESVFWRPSDETLELQSLTIRIEPITASAVMLSIQSVCFDHHGNVGLNVEILGAAEIRR